MNATSASWNPFDCNQFVSITDQNSKFELREVYQEVDKERGVVGRNVRIKSTKEVRKISCYDWYPFYNPNALVAYGTSSGTVSLLNLAGHHRDFLLFNANGPAKRVCTSVAWNKHCPTQFAASFENIRRFVG